MQSSPMTVYSTSQVAEILGCSYQSVFNHIKSGRLKANKAANHRYYVARENLESFINPVKETN